MLRSRNPTEPIVIYGCSDGQVQMIDLVDPAHLPHCPQERSEFFRNLCIQHHVDQLIASQGRTPIATEYNEIRLKAQPVNELD